MFARITRLAGKAMFKLKDASPTILTVVGIGSLVSAGLMAAKASMDVKPVLDDLNEMKEEIETRDTSLIPENTRQAYIETFGKLARMYAPAIGLAAIGTASILYGHGILKKRNAALVAAYGLIEQAYSAYRDRVRETIGEEAEEHIYKGGTGKIEGVEKGVVKWEPTRPTPSESGSPYTMQFGPGNGNWNDSHPEYNLVFLRAQQRYANDRLRAHGVLLLNDVLDSLGMKRTKAGLVTGWVWNGKGDNFVDFGLFEAGSPEEADYFYFYDGEGPIFLEFNVDGLITEQFKDKE